MTAVLGAAGQGRFVPVSETATHASEPPLEMPEQGKAKVIVLAILLGIGGALVASLFLAVLTAGQNFIWKDLPSTLGVDAASWWFILPCTLIGAAIVALAYRLPGHTGGSPITGLHFDVGYQEIASVALAALGSLIFGLPLGPEAPLIACGTALGAIVTRKADPEARKLAMLLGGAAAIGAIFGNPFVTAFLFLEFAALGILPVMALLPLLVSLGTGYLVLTGLGRFSGLGQHEMSIDGLATVTRLTGVDFAMGLLVAVVAAVMLMVARSIGWRVIVLAQRMRLPVLFGAAVIIALIAAGASAWSGLSLQTVLFDGESGLPEVIAATSGTAVLIVTVAKMLVYGTALGSGFRGGPVFPSMAIGVGVATFCALFLDPSHESPLVVAGVAAGVAAGLRLPFSAGMLALLITSSAGAVTAPLAILGAIVGYLIRVQWDRTMPPPVLAPAAAAPVPAST